MSNFHEDIENSLFMPPLLLLRMLVFAGENHLTEDYMVTDKTMGLLKQHLRETGGKVYTGRRLMIQHIVSQYQTND